MATLPYLVYILLSVCLKWWHRDWSVFLRPFWFYSHICYIYSEILCICPASVTCPRRHRKTSLSNLAGTQRPFEQGRSCGCTQGAGRPRNRRAVRKVKINACSYFVIKQILMPKIKCGQSWSKNIFYNVFMLLVWRLIFEQSLPIVRAYLKCCKSLVAFFFVQ